MARLTRIETTTDPELQRLIDKVKAARGGRLLNLYKALLHSPPMAEGWLDFFTAVRWKGVLADRHRELAILRVARLTGAEYEYENHIPFALKGGMTRSQIEALDAWENSPLFDGAEKAILRYATHMTRDIRVPDAAFAAVREHFSERETAELTITIAGYNAVSRFLEAMQVDHEE